MTDPVSGFRLASRFIGQTGAQLFMTDDTSAWTLTTGSALPDFPASKLQSELVSDAWVAYNSRASNIWIQTTGFVTAQNIRLIGLLGINRVAPTSNISGYGNSLSQIRVRIDSYSLADRIRLPLTITSKTNLSGSDSDFTGHPIDPPDDPAPSGYAETKLSPTSLGSATSLIGTWTNPYATERALAGTQTVRIHVMDANNPSLIPLLTANIYQSSSLSLSLTSPTYEWVVVANSSGGYIFTYTFDASSLASQTAVMELRASTTTACYFIGCEIVCNHTGYLYDSGDLDYTGQDLTSFAQRLDFPVTGTYWIHVQPSDFYLYNLTTRNFVGGGTTIVRYASPIINPGDADGRFRAGRFLASDAIITPINGINGWNLTTQTNSSPSRTRSGSFHGSRSSLEWLEADMSIVGVSRQTVQKIEKLVNTLGIMHTPTLIVPDLSMSEGYIDEQTKPRWMVVGSKAETHIGRMTGRETDYLADGNNHTRDRWDMALHWVEHNGRRSGGG